MTDVYTSALSGMKVSKAELALNAHNVANSDVEGYTRLMLDKTSNITGSQVSGVNIQAITTMVDEGLQDTIYGKISTNELHKTLKNYYSRIHESMGSPGDSNSIDASINKFYNSLEMVAANPNSASLKLVAVQDAEAMSQKIAGLAQSLENMRFEIDMQIDKDVKALNVELDNAYRINGTVNSFPAGALERVDAEDRRWKSLEKISEYLDVTRYKGDNNSYKVFSGDGVSLVGESQYFLKYKPLTSVEDFTNNEPFEAITVSYYNSDGTDAQFNRDLVSSGKSSEITHNLKGGKLYGLLELRDKEIPKVLDQLDLLAKNAKEQFNRVHNQGVSFNAPTTLDGNGLFTRDQYLGFTGKMRVGVVNENGKAHAGIPSVEIDLAKLDTGEGAGKANIHGLMQEIDYHFGSKLTTMNKVNYLSAVDDIKLAFTTKDINPSSSFTLDLDISNMSQLDATVSIQSATAVDSLAGNVLGSFNGAAHTATAGTLGRTTALGPSVTINTPPTINYPITINLGVRVNDGTTDHDATITYVVNSTSPDATNGHINNRIGATAVVGAATLVAPTLSSSVLTTNMRAIDGQTLAVNSTDLGTMSINSTADNYKIVIDDAASIHTGITGTTNIATNERLSYYFGLNDFFVKNGDRASVGTTKNSAYFMDVRGDIKQDSSKVAAGKLKQRQDHTTPTNKIYEYEVYDGDNENLINLVNLNKEKVAFVGAGTLPPTKVTAENYATEIIGFNTSRYRAFNSLEAESGVVRRALAEKIQNIKGVDINEEMANMILYQQSFTASARMINAAREMDQIILDLLK